MKISRTVIRIPCTGEQLKPGVLETTNPKNGYHNTNDVPKNE